VRRRSPALARAARDLFLAGGQRLDDERVFV
jgi:hypothetical protein